MLKAHVRHICFEQRGHIRAKISSLKVKRQDRCVRIRGPTGWNNRVSIGRGRGGGGTLMLPPVLLSSPTTKVRSRPSPPNPSRATCTWMQPANDAQIHSTLYFLDQGEWFASVIVHGSDHQVYYDSSALW